MKSFPLIDELFLITANDYDNLLNRITVVTPQTLNNKGFFLKNGLIYFHF